MDNNMGSKVKKDEDFDEDEVWQNWALVKKDSSFRNKKKPEYSSSGSKKIPTGGRGGQYQSSSPMSIPDDSSWDSAKSYDNYSTYGCLNDDDEMVPPHEIVARRQSRNHIVSYSMCEGVGRTLKGRDLSKLRNSILTKTGFLE